MSASMVPAQSSETEQERQLAVVEQTIQQEMHAQIRFSLVGIVGVGLLTAAVLLVIHPTLKGGAL